MAHFAPAAEPRDLAEWKRAQEAVARALAPTGVAVIHLVPRAAELVLAAWAASDAAADGSAEPETRARMAFALAAALEDGMLDAAGRPQEDPCTLVPAPFPMGKDVAAVRAVLAASQRLGPAAGLDDLGARLQAVRDLLAADPRLASRQAVADAAPGCCPASDTLVSWDQAAVACVFGCVRILSRECLQQLQPYLAARDLDAHCAKMVRTAADTVRFSALAFAPGCAPALDTSVLVGRLREAASRTPTLLYQAARRVGLLGPAAAAQAALAAALGATTPYPLKAPCAVLAAADAVVGMVGDEAPTAATAPPAATTVSSTMSSVAALVAKLQRRNIGGGK